LFDHLLQKEVQEYIKDFKQELARLAFSGSPFTDVSTKELLQQIESRQKAKTKLPNKSLLKTLSKNWRVWPSLEALLLM